MELCYRLLEFNNGPAYERLKAELDRLGVKYTVKKLGVSPSGEALSLEYIASESDPLFREIEKLVDSNEFHIQCSVRFSEQEKQAAEWLHARVSESQYPQPESGFRYLQATYDTTHYCQRCGMGAEQVEPFRLTSDFKLKRSHFMGLHWVFDEIFIRPMVRSIFEQESITGVSYCHPMHNKSSQQILTTFQLRIGTNPNWGLVTDQLVAEMCHAGNRNATLATGRAYSAEYPFCGRIKYNYPTRDAIRFRRESLQNSPDIIKSREYFGSGANAHRLILVSRKLADVIQEHNLRGIVLTPVLLE